MQEKIDAYFADCEGELLRDANGDPVLDKYGNEIYSHQRPPTVTGLALALGFASRKSLLEYQGKQEFVNTITRAKTRCEQYAEERLFDRDGTNGARFSLQANFGWKDKPQENTTEAQNNDMQTLADLLQRPVPNRDIKDFEE
jgi:hypothetical protein